MQCSLKELTASGLSLKELSLLQNACDLIGADRSWGSQCVPAIFQCHLATHHQPGM